MWVRSNDQWDWRGVSASNNYYSILHFPPLYLASISSSALMFILIPAVPPILNVITPLNESRGREFVYPAYYFVDEQRYYYLILAHMISMALVLAAVYIACDINLIHIIHHGCALVTICGSVYFNKCVCMFLAFFSCTDCWEKENARLQTSIKPA